MNVNLVETFEEAETFMSWLGERRPVLACDTETGGLDWWRDELRMVQFGDFETGWSIPFHLWGGLALNAIKQYTGPITFHNAKFDVRYLNTNGANLSYTNVHDTRVMACLIDPAARSGLKDLATRWLGANSDDWESALKRTMALGKWTWATVPVTSPEYWQYAAMDTILTARLHQKLKPMITGRLEEIYELEIAVEGIIDRMERKGVHIDLPYCKARAEELAQTVEAIADWCVTKYGFGPGSNKKVADALIADGIHLEKETAGGSYSVDETVLTNIDHPLAMYVLKSRKAAKYGNAYFSNYIDLADGDLLHPDVNTLGARTGRMSISRPALQQIPREKLLRDAFIPSAGNRLVSVDYDQIEMRLFAHFCQDPELIQAFKEEGDFFLNAASSIHGTRITDKKDDRRQLTKNASYAIVYGAGCSRFAQTAGVSYDQASSFMANYNRTFPGVEVFQKQLIALARQRGIDEGHAYITTPNGRRQPAEDDALFKLVNYLVQGTAADIFKQSLVKLDDMGITEYFVLPVHDEVVFDVPEADAVAIGTEISATMERNDFTVPLTCGVDILDRWGDKYVD
jgi:DNA polymerase-1